MRFINIVNTTSIDAAAASPIQIWLEMGRTDGVATNFKFSLKLVWLGQINHDARLCWWFRCIEFHSFNWIKTKEISLTLDLKHLNWPKWWRCQRVNSALNLFSNEQHCFMSYLLGDLMEFQTTWNIIFKKIYCFPKVVRRFKSRTQSMVTDVQRIHILWFFFLLNFNKSRRDFTKVNKFPKEIKKNRKSMWFISAMKL